MDANAIKAWLDFVSTLIWQGLIVGCAVYFRNEPRNLVARIGRTRRRSACWTSVSIGTGSIPCGYIPIKGRSKPTSWP